MSAKDSDMPGEKHSDEAGEYQARINRELENHSRKEIVHDLPPIANYWAEKYLLPVGQAFGYNSINAFYCDYVRKAAQQSGGPLTLTSIGAGNCDTEVLLARTLLEAGIDDFYLECIELNPDMLARGRAHAQREQLDSRMGFTCVDINAWQPVKDTHVIIANQSLHHFLQLEQLFEKIEQALHPDGFFLTHDMIGRNGHQRWPEALAMVEKLWAELPQKYKYNHQWQQVDEQFINRDCALKSFEGIRAQDILPLLLEYFRFDFFLAYANVIDVFIDRGYGPNFDPQNSQDREFIDQVQALDQLAIEEGRIKPTHITAAMTKKNLTGEARYFKHLTPEFCLRIPAS